MISTIFSKKLLISGCAALLVSGVLPGFASAQDRLPRDNGIFTYHTMPRYRSSESHPLRVLAYGVHPVGWILREGVTRPLSYLASSTEFTRSFMGYREPYDFREPECFSPDSSVPDCRSILPFNYMNADVVTDVVAVERHVYFPDVNFDFDVRTLNKLGKGRVQQIANLLKESAGVHVVLEGHTDYIGSDEYNDKLGMDRAEAVRTELVAHGIDSATLSTVTFGKSKPLIDEQTDAARAVNRRVEVNLDEDRR